MSNRLDRRDVLALMAGAFSMAIVAPASSQAYPKVMMWKDSNCGCCGAWADHLRRSGFEVSVIDSQDMQAIKARLGVPESLVSCHTAQVGDYVIEGHVPAAAVKKLLAEKPAAKGLAVPGMPMGSPGMEGGAPDIYDVVLFGTGEAKTFQRYRGYEPV